MKYSHEDIREILPEYLSGKLSDTEKAAVEEHAGSCAECREDLVLLSELSTAAVPDPGDVFWESLPRRVVILSVEKKTGINTLRRFLKPLPLAASATLAVLGLLIFIHTDYFAGDHSDPLFVDPLSAAFIDYSLLTDEDITEIGRELLSGTNIMDVPEGSFPRGSYHKDLVSLSSEGVNSLSQALDNLNTQGGML